MNLGIRLAGVGSQGMVSSSVELAQALGVLKDYEVVQTQEYYAAITGGSALGDVMVSDEKIVMPWVFEPDILVAMAQDAVVQHAAAMRPGTRVVVDDLMVGDVSAFGPGVSVHRAPMVRLADEAGSRRCANIVALGVFARFTGLLTLEEIAQAVAERAPGKPEVNQRALRLGWDATLTQVA